MVPSAPGLLRSFDGEVTPCDEHRVVKDLGNPTGLAVSRGVIVSSIRHSTMRHTLTVVLSQESRGRTSSVESIAMGCGLYPPRLVRGRRITRPADGEQRSTRGGGVSLKLVRSPVPKVVRGKAMLDAPKTTRSVRDGILMQSVGTGFLNELRSQNMDWLSVVSPGSELRFTKRASFARIWPILAGERAARMPRPTGSNGKRCVWRGSPR